VESAEEQLAHLRGPAGDGTWCFWWSWGHPIGTVDDIGMAARRIMTVLRSVDAR
jgi:hypothetical protein